ncbi:MAG: FtsX-like permease family protein [Ruminococcus sp.]|nr:FtsX-like permease family protein [Ruminococcus sp.]
MKFILKNLKSFIQNEKMIFLLIFICIITSSFIINFSYGLYQNYNVIKEEEESENYNITIDINDKSNVSKEKIKKCVLSISPETNDKIIMYSFNLEIEPFTEESNWGLMRTDFTIRNNHFHPCEILYKNLQELGNWQGGEYFNEQQEINGELVAVVHSINTISQDNCFTTPLTTRIEGNKRWIMVQNKEYEVIGYNTVYSAPLIPFESLDEDTMFRDFIYISFENPITNAQYKEVKKNFEATFGDAVTVPDLDIPEAEIIYLYNTIILISIMIAVLAAINFAVLYRYILSKRTKTLAVFRICGCTKFKALGMFLSECMMIAVPLFALTTLIYDKFVLPKLGKHFEYIESAYSTKLYLLIFGIYIAATLVVLIFMISGFLRKNIREAKEER